MTPNRRLRLEGRRAFPTRLDSVMGHRRHAVLTVSALLVGAAVALLVGTVRAPPVDDHSSFVAVGAVALGLGAAAFAVYVVARVFLVLDLRALPEPSWRHDGILERFSTPGKEAGAGAAPVDVEPLRAAVDLALTRGLWGVLIGWSQCGVGAGVFVAAALTFPATPWIVDLAAFVVGGLGQDGAYRAYRSVGRAVIAERVLAAGTRQPASAPTGTPDNAAAAATGTGIATGTPGVTARGRRSSRRMPPRAPGRGSALELPDE